MFYISFYFYISRYHFSQYFGTSFNITLSRIFLISQIHSPPTLPPFLLTHTQSCTHTYYTHNSQNSLCVVKDFCWYPLRDIVLLEYYDLFSKSWQDHFQMFCRLQKALFPNKNLYIRQLFRCTFCKSTLSYIIKGMD